MKKLLLILSAISITTVSATTVVACGPNNINFSEDDFVNSINNQMEKETYIATSDITKSILLGRSENLSVNQVNNFENNSEGLSILPKFQNSKKNDGTTYGNRFSEHFNTWNNVFSSNFNGDKIDPNVKEFQDFIIEESLKIDVSNKDNKNLYSLKKQENLLPLMMSNNDLNQISENATPNFHTKEYEITGPENDNLEYNLKTWQNLIASGMQDIGNILQNLDGTKVPVVFGVMGNLFAISKTNGGVINPSDPSKGVGGLKNLWMGHRDFPVVSMMFTWRTAYATYKYPKGHVLGKGDKVGALTALYEKIWIQMVLNKKTLVEQMGQELYNYIVGTNINYYEGDESKPYLIEDVFKEAAYEIVEGTNDWNNVAFSSTNNGLYGTLINKIGSVKKYNEGNVKAGVVDKYGESMSYSKNEYHGIEQSVIEVLKVNVELFNITRSVIEEETLFEIIEEGMSSFGPLLIMISTMLGINISDKLLLADFAVEFLEWYLDFENDKQITKDTSVDDIKEIFNNGFKMTTVNQLREANPYSIKETNWFSDNNTEYRNEVYKALGYDEKDGFIEGKLFYNLKETMQKEKYKNLFKASDISEYVKNIDNIINKNLIANNVWTPSNYQVKYKDSNLGFDVIDNVTYTLEYNGLGYKEVSAYKASGEEIKDKSTNEILNIMAQDSENYNLDVKNKINGEGSISDLTNVKHRYTVQWVNVSNDPSTVDMKLSIISNPEVYINGSWIKMKI